MANITVTLFWDMDLRKWTTTLDGTTETDPIQGLVQGDIVKFAVRFVQGGVAVALTAPVFTASAIKADNDFTGSYLIQLSAPVLSDTTLYTFTVSPLNSANLNTFLQTYRNTWCALEIYDSANGILTTPLELQITPGYSLSGTPTDNVAGVISVAAGKTVTFPLSLTFPAAAGTNGYHLALLNSTTGTTEWVVDATGSGTVTTTGTMTANAIVLSNGTTVIKSTTTGAGVVTALGNTPNAAGGIVTFSGNIGAATVTSLNAATGTLTLGAQTINLAAGAGGAGGSINLAAGSNSDSAGGSINLSGGSVSSNEGNYGGSINLSGSSGINGDLSHGGSIDLSAGDGVNCSGGSINLSGGAAIFGGSINTSNGGGSINTTAGGSITTGIGSLTGPSASGTVALTTDVIAGQYGGTGVANTGKTITLGASLTTTGAGAATFALGASTQTYTFPTTTATLARTDAAQTFTGSSQTVATVNTTNTLASSAGAATANFIVQNTSTQNYAHVSIGLRACSGSAPTIGYNGIISLDGAGRFNFGGDGGNSNSLNVTNAAASGSSGAGVTLTGGGNITAIGALAITGASTLTGNLTSNGALISTPQALSGTTLGAINITTLTTTLAATGVATATLTATGVVNGQIKVIVMTQATGACTVTVTNASWGGATTAVFDAVGDTIMLQYLNSKWTPISNIGVVLA